MKSGDRETDTEGEKYLIGLKTCDLGSYYVLRRKVGKERGGGRMKCTYEYVIAVPNYS